MRSRLSQSIARCLAPCLALPLFLGGCAQGLATFATSDPKIAAPTDTYEELIQLPPPKGKIRVAVYGFRDQSGQYKPLTGATSFSTAVTQGGASMLVQTLKDSQWFIPIEREGLQNLLTERKIVRASLKAQGLNEETELPPLEVAQLIVEGGVIAYDTNLTTGGLGAKYFGLGGDIQYRVDQVRISLRAVDVRSGRILKSITTTKTILSREIAAGVFRYLKFKRLLEAEGGLTTNEPAQLAVLGAIEKAVIGLIVEGACENLWELQNAADFNRPVIRDYLEERGLPLPAAATPRPIAGGSNLLPAGWSPRR